MSPGPHLVRLTLPDSVAAWTNAGFTARGGVVRIGPLTLALDEHVEGPVLGFDRPHPAGATDLDGLPWATVDGADADTSAAVTHPNRVCGVDHVVIMAPDLERMRTALVDAGLGIRRERPTTMGATAVTQLFAWAGDVLLEVVAPTEPATGSGHEPAGLFGTCLVSDDLDATAEWFAEHAGRPRPAVQAGRRILTVRHRDFGMTFTLAVMDRRETHRQSPQVQIKHPQSS